MLNDTAEASCGSVVVSQRWWRRKRGSRRGACCVLPSHVASGILHAPDGTPFGGGVFAEIRGRCQEERSRGSLGAKRRRVTCCYKYHAKVPVELGIFRFTVRGTFGGKGG